MIIAIDFDGTCVTHDYPAIGRSVGAEDVLHDITAYGHQLVLFTMRSEEQLKQAIEWFHERHIPLYGINENPNQKSWTTSPKVYAQIYIDDAALGCPLIYGEHSRPYVDWTIVRELLSPILKLKEEKL